MHTLQAIIMGIIQGLSEFLPISSSGHLVITSNLYKFFTGIEQATESNQEVFLDIMLHFGTLVAVWIYFRKEIHEIFWAMVKAIKEKDFSSYDAKLALFIIAGTAITTAVALPMYGIIEDFLFSPIAVGFLLLGTGILLIGSEYFSGKLTEKEDKVNWKTAILMAIAQGLAALPGFSRSGLTISTGLLCKRERVCVARYSFLLSIPIIFGASMVFPIAKLDFSELATFNWKAIILGTIVSGVTGYLCVKYFMKLISKYSLSFFGYYCLIVGVLTLGFFTFIAK